MIERNANWATLDDAEKAEWLTEHVLHVAAAKILDYNLVQTCVARLDAVQRKQFVANMLSEVAAHTYDGLTQAEIESDQTRENFYFNCVSQTPDVIGKCIHWAIRGEGV